MPAAPTPFLTHGPLSLSPLACLGLQETLSDPSHKFALLLGKALPQTLFLVLNTFLPGLLWCSLLLAGHTAHTPSASAARQVSAACWPDRTAAPGCFHSLRLVGSPRLARLFHPGQTWCQPSAGELPQQDAEVKASADGSVAVPRGLQPEEGPGTAGREGAGRVQAPFARSVNFMEGVSDWWFGTHSQGIAGSK